MDGEARAKEYQTVYVKPTGSRALFKKPAGTAMDEIIDSGRSSQAKHTYGSLPKSMLQNNMILQNDVSATFIGYGLKIDESQKSLDGQQTLQLSPPPVSPHILN